jgi:hypothetical protein
MFSNIGIGQLCGFLFLFILLTTALSTAMAGGPLDPEDVPNTLGSVAEGGKRYRASVVLDLVSHVSIVALAAALYLAFSPYNRSVALLGTLWRVAEGTIIALNEANNLMLLGVAQRFVSAAGAEAVALEAMGRTLILAEDWGYKIGLAFFALGSLMYGILFVSSGAVPRTLGWLGVVASLLASAGIWLNLLSPNVRMVSFMAVMLIPYEVVLGIWLLLRGGPIGQP